MDRQACRRLVELVDIRLLRRQPSPIERGLNLRGGYAFEGLNQNMGAFVRQEDTNIYDPQGLSGQPGPTLGEVRTVSTPSGRACLSWTEPGGRGSPGAMT